MHYLHVKGSGITLDAIRAAMMRLPGLNSLSFDGCFSNTELPLGVENLPKGEIHGVLKLHAGLAHRDVFNMLMNIPPGLHFTRVDIAKVDGNFFSDALALVKACEHSVKRVGLAPHGKSLRSRCVCDLAINPFSGMRYVDHTFKFSSFPSLGVLEFDLSWMKGENVSALETINPTAWPRLWIFEVVHSWQYHSGAPEGLDDQLTRISGVFSHIVVTFTLR